MRIITQNKQKKIKLKKLMKLLIRFDLVMPLSNVLQKKMIY